jgi:hypothetical protein
VSKGLEHYTQELSEYLANKFLIAMTGTEIARNRAISTSNSSPSGSAPPTATVSKDSWDTRLGRDKVLFRNNLRGEPDVDQKTVDDDAAIGGLRDAHRSVSRLSYL